MSKKINIGKVTVDQLRKADKRAGRELELENSTGWTAKHKVHKDKSKQVHRKRKHKGRDF